MLSSPQDMRIVFNALEGSYALCLIANLVHLAYLQRETVIEEDPHPFVVSFLYASPKIGLYFSSTWFNRVMNRFSVGYNQSTEQLPGVRCQQTV